MEKINCLIVEDEPLAAEILKDYIEQLPFLSLVDICRDAIFALDTLREKRVDLLFLDIHLPKLHGLDFLRSLPEPPAVILTTAYHQYALEGYELEVLDYLVKPIEFNRFLKAVNKLKDQRPLATPTPTAPGITDKAFHFFPVNRRKEKVYLDEILFIESLKEYVRIVTEDKEVVTKFQIGEIDNFLQNPNLLRIHRSYVVAIDKIKAFSATEIEIAGKALPIGRSYQVQVAQILNKL